MGRGTTSVASSTTIPAFGRKRGGFPIVVVCMVATVRGQIGVFRATPVYAAVPDSVA